ncbi:MAG: AMP-binding protein, partial [bacterium]|nr:AMP-binding protein [bacterium]
IFKIDQTQYEFLWSNHHILMDGWCSGILIDEFLEIYTGFLENREYRLPPVTPYRAYIKWLEKQTRENSGDYWKMVLGSYEESVGVPGNKLKSPQGNVEYSNQTVPLALDPETVVKLNTLASGNNATLNSIIQAIWAILLGKYNAKEDVVFGSVVSGRPAQLEGVETMVGLFINTIPVRIRFEQDTTFSRLIRSVQAEAIAGMQHHYYPLAKIQSQSQLKQELINHILVFESLSINQQLQGQENQGRSPLTLSSVDAFEQTNYDFNLIIGGGTQLQLQFKFNGNVYDIDFVRRMAQHFHLLVKQVIENEEIEINELNLLSDSGKRQILEEFNDTTCEYPRDKSIHGLFEEQVERTPDRIALVGEITNYNEQITNKDHVSISYSQLDRMADGVARYLIEKGTLADTIVGIMVERSVEMIIGIFGILKAGGAYLPIDPDYPKERIDFMLKDSGTGILLLAPWKRTPAAPPLNEASQPPLSRVELAGVELIGLEGLSGSTYSALGTGNASNAGSFFSPLERGAPRNEGWGVSKRGTSPNGLAYVIYTSGSTGKPKGVLIEHHSV